MNYRQGFCVVLEVSCSVPYLNSPGLGETFLLLGVSPGFEKI